MPYSKLFIIPIISSFLDGPPKNEGEITSTDGVRKKDSQKTILKLPYWEGSKFVRRYIIKVPLCFELLKDKLINEK